MHFDAGILLGTDGGKLCDGAQILLPVCRAERVDVLLTHCFVSPVSDMATGNSSLSLSSGGIRPIDPTAVGAQQSQ